MSQSAYIAHSAFWIPDESVIARVKLATLLFDTLHWSVPDPLTFALGTAASGKRLSQPAESELARIWRGPASDLPRYNIYGSQEDRVLQPEDAPDLFQATRESLIAAGLSADDHYDDYKLAIYTMSEILYWRRHMPAATFVGHDLSDQALHRYASTVSVAQPLREVAVPSPNLFDLSWDDIVSLRKSKFLKAFRLKYVELCATGQLSELVDRYQMALESLADEIRPNVGRTAASGVLSNLPIPVVNPLGVASSLYAVAREARIAKTFGWAFFVRDARALKHDDMSPKDG